MNKSTNKGHIVKYKLLHFEEEKTLNFIKQVGVKHYCLSVPITASGAYRGITLAS